MNRHDRDHFDMLTDEVLGSLPPRVLALLEEAPLIVEDAPKAALLQELERDHEIVDADEICGLHTGTMLTERSIEQSGDLPTQIHLFRRGIVAQAGGWLADGASDRIREEIRITLLHEIGHHFGLEEDDLESLGFA